jgi:hypothetical protein
MAAPSDRCFGWRVPDYDGEQRLRLASAAYRGDYGKVEATAILSQSGFAGTISQESAVVVPGGGVFIANRIDDAFARFRLALKACGHRELPSTNPWGRGNRRATHVLASAGMQVRR